MKKQAANQSINQKCKKRKQRSFELPSSPMEVKGKLLRETVRYSTLVSYVPKASLRAAFRPAAAAAGVSLQRPNSISISIFQKGTYKFITIAIDYYQLSSWVPNVARTKRYYFGSI